MDFLAAEGFLLSENYDSSIKEDNFTNKNLISPSGLFLVKNVSFMISSAA